MTNISYKSSIPGSIAEELAQGFTHISFDKLPHGGIFAVYLWHTNDTGLKIQTVMHDIKDRVEVGVIEISRTTELDTKQQMLKLPDDFHTNLKGFKLVLSISNVNVDSGISLKSNQGNEIIIVAGDQPYTIAINAPFIKEKYESEYELSMYSYEPMNNK